MADFCKQCSEDMFGEDFGDLANLAGPHDVHALCEGCGATVVGPDGSCKTDCLEHHCPNRSTPGSDR